MGSQRILSASCWKGVDVKANNWALVLFVVFSFGFGILLACETHSRSATAPKPAGETQSLFTPEAASLSQQKMCDGHTV